MYSLNTGWQRERCRATLALRQLGEGRQERENLPQLPGCRSRRRVSRQGLHLRPFAPTTLGFPSGKVEGGRRQKDGSALSSSLPSSGGGSWRSPGNRSKLFRWSPRGAPWRIQVMVEGEQKPPGASFCSLFKRLR